VERPATRIAKRTGHQLMPMFHVKPSPQPQPDVLLLLAAFLRAATAPLVVSRYDQLSPVERQRKAWRERQRKHRLKVLIEVKIPRRKEICARMRNGDRDAARLWGHYEMSCIANRRMRALGFPNLRKATANATAARERRKRQVEVEKLGHSF
jgi:hypothetical protein